MTQAEWINAIIDDFKVDLRQKNAGPNEYFVRTILNPDSDDYITKLRKREGKNGETGFIGDAEALIERK